MLSGAYKACMVAVLILVQERMQDASANSESNIDVSKPALQEPKDKSTASLKVKELEQKLLEATEKQSRLIDICHSMRAKRLRLDLEYSQLTSDNIVLREKLDYQQMNPCPWDIIVGNMTGTALEKLNDIGTGMPCRNDQHLSKRSKKHSKRKNDTVPREEPLASDDPLLAVALTDVAFALQASDRHEDAEPFFAWALMIMYKGRAGNPLSTATALKNLANLYLDMNEYQKAEGAYRRALAEYRFVFDDDHPKIASIQNMLAASLRGQKSYFEAEQMYLKSIATYKSAYNGHHARLVAPIHNLAQLYMEMSRYEDAAVRLVSAMTIVENNKAAKQYKAYLEDSMRRLDKSMVTPNVSSAEKEATGGKEEL